MSAVEQVKCGKFHLSILSMPNQAYLIKCTDYETYNGLNYTPFDDALTKLHLQGIIRTGVIKPNVRKWPGDTVTWRVANEETKKKLLHGLSTMI
jgi:hypothetical protein